MPGALNIRVKVKPNARASSLERLEDGSWRARLKAPPVDGKANEALVEFLAEHYGVPRRSVTIESGLHSRQKKVTIWNPTRNSNP